MMKSLGIERRRLVLASIFLIAISVGGLVAYVVEDQLSPLNVQVVEISNPITHTPTFLGSYPFILGGGNLLQNGTAYSYVRINASALKRGDSFAAFPALNVGLEGKGINENNFTVEIIYVGSLFGSSPDWLNFSVMIPVLRMSVNSSQIGISGSFSRSNVSVPGSNGAEFFVQISNVVNSYNEFEYFFYIGNSTIPIPKLTHGPVH
jgi:hypothetical protein